MTLSLFDDAHFECMACQSLQLRSHHVHRHLGPVSGRSLARTLAITMADLRHQPPSWRPHLRSRQARNWSTRSLPPFVGIHQSYLSDRLRIKRGGERRAILVLSAHQQWTAEDTANEVTHGKSERGGRCRARRSSSHGRLSHVSGRRQRRGGQLQTLDASNA